METIKKIIKKHKLDSILLYNANISLDLFNKKTTFHNYKLIENSSKRTYEITFTPWELEELSYYSILYTNDYRGKDINDLETFQLFSHFKFLKEEESKLQLEKKIIENEDIKTKLLFGLAQEQFWYQDILYKASTRDTFSRYYILLNKIPKKIKSKINPDQEIFKLTGFNIHDLSLLLSVLLTSFSKNTACNNVELNEDIKKMNPILTDDNVMKAIKLFSEHYSYYRNSPIKHKAFYIKPIIETDKSLFIISNVFIIYRVFYEGIYWMIRNLYYEKKSQDFINEFGIYYEYYIEDLLNFYLNSKTFIKINETNSKTADWFIETNNFIILIEQKSTLMAIQLKKQFPEITLLDKYLLKFIEALKQLNETIKTIGSKSKKIISFILHFETLYLGENVLKDRMKVINNEYDFIYFFIETYEFEYLIQILSTDEELFNQIINEKIKIESDQNYLGGRDYNQIIFKYYNKPISYLDNNHPFLKI